MSSKVFDFDTNSTKRLETGRFFIAKNTQVSIFWLFFETGGETKTAYDK
jgi:hypothetical protein